MNQSQLEIEKIRQKIVPEYGQLISVDEGWYQLVINCDAELSALDANYKIYQIKEKFGGLRYYFEPSQSTKDYVVNKMADVVRIYEDMSYNVCEATGQVGIRMISPGGHHKTLNPKFAAETPHLASYKPVSISDDEWWNAIK